MATLKAITEFLEKRFPPEYAEDFDNIGLLIGRSERSVSKVLVCLDCDENVVAEASRKGAELIVTHHPVIFNPVKNAADVSSGGKMLVSAIEKNISVYSAHTNLDSAPGGLTEYLCSLLGLVPIANLCGHVGRICNAPEGETVYSLCERIKKTLGVKHVFTTAHCDRAIKTVSVCNGGGGGDVAQKALESGAEVYISGDLKHHEIREIFLAEGIDYIEIRHHDSEKIVRGLLKNTLESAFPEIEIIVSAANVNPLICK